MCYFDNAICHPQESIDAISHALCDPKFGDIDLIVGTGVSGLLLLTPVSLKSGIPCGVVRKSTDSNKSVQDGGSHSCALVETDYKYQNCRYVSRYIIIDDLIDSGGTIIQISKRMKQGYPNSECVGVILYQQQLDNKHCDYPVSAIGKDIVVLGDMLKKQKEVQNVA